MKNNKPIISKKNLTRLLNKEFRLKILSMINADKDKYLSLSTYAKYVVDSQIVSRDKTHENDKNAYYGFSPINVICAIRDDGEIVKHFFEFNIINHFLKDHQGEIAIEVVKCILLLWMNEDKHIVSFDYNKIDEELTKIEEEYTKKQERQKR